MRMLNFSMIIITMVMMTIVGVVGMSITIVGLTTTLSISSPGEKFAEDRLHPDREGMKSVAQVAADRVAVLLVIENGGETGEDAIAVGHEHILEPVERLHDAHRRPTGPVQPARRGLLERDPLVAEADWTQPRVGERSDAGRDRGGQAEVVCGSQPVDDQADLVAPGDGIDDCSGIGSVWLAGEVADTRLIVEAAVDTTEVPSRS